MKTTARLTAIALAAAALALPAQAAFAADAPAARTAGTSRGAAAAQGIEGHYKVLNLTGETLTIAQHAIDGQWVDGTEPVDRYQIHPGYSEDFGVVEWFGGGNQGTVDFRIGDGDEYLRVTAVPQFGQGLRGEFLNSTGRYTFTRQGAYNDTLILTTAAGVIHDVPAGDSQQEYQVLKQLQGNDNVHVKFTPTKRENTVADPALAGKIVRNTSDTEVEYEYGWRSKTTIGSEWGVEAGIELGVEGVVKVSASAHYGQTFESETVADGKVTIPIEPHHAAWVTYQGPVTRVTGNFVITVGNEEWDLTGVYFDLPTPGADDDGGVMDTHQLPIGDPGVPSGAIVNA